MEMKKRSDGIKRIPNKMSEKSTFELSIIKK